jgi:signal transduction histidine kinase
LLNLINNAFQAVHERKLKEDDFEPKVTVRTRTEGNQIIFEVEDNGAGIPDDVKDKIFQPFYTTKPTGQGTGLGLSLSYDIITKGHGGQLKVETEVGEPTVFIVILPV